jgi:hypothetical protein
MADGRLTILQQQGRDGKLSGSLAAMLNMTRPDKFLSVIEPLDCLPLEGLSFR